MTGESGNEQKRRIDERSWDWLVICDAGRYDWFEQLYSTYLAEASSPDRVTNGRIGYTADWMGAMFPGSHDGLFVHGGQPIYSMQAGEWDEREHFETVPAYSEFEWSEQYNTCPPDVVNGVVRRYIDGHDRGVVRYLQPHPPFREMPERTKGRDTRMQSVANAVRAGELSLEKVAASYRDNYEWVLEEGVADLVPDLDGTVVVTADHGECLGDCHQWFHGRAHDPHDHLVTVPWTEIA